MQKRLRMSMMIFIFLCFSGLFVMFFFILRGQEKIHAALREELALLRAHVRHPEAAAGLPNDELSGNAASALSSAAPLGSAPLNMARADTGRADMSRMDPLDSLSMDTSTPTAGGLDLHFDPQQDFRR